MANPQQKRAARSLLFLGAFVGSVAALVALGESCKRYASGGPSTSQAPVKVEEQRVYAGEVIPTTTKELMETGEQYAGGLGSLFAGKRLLVTGNVRGIDAGQGIVKMVGVGSDYVRMEVRPSERRKIDLLRIGQVASIECGFRDRMFGNMLLDDCSFPVSRDEVGHPKPYRPQEEPAIRLTRETLEFAKNLTAKLKKLERAGSAMEPLRAGHLEIGRLRQCGKSMQKHHAELKLLATKVDLLPAELRVILGSVAVEIAKCVSCDESSQDSCNQAKEHIDSVDKSLHDAR